MASFHLGEHLVELGVLSENHLRAALAEQSVTGERLGRILVRNGFVSQNTLIKVLEQEDPSRLADEHTFSNVVPADLLIKLNTIVIAELDTRVYLATLGPETYVKKALEHYFPGKEIVFTALMPEKLEHYKDQLFRFEDQESGLMERLLRDALIMKASDIHIVPREYSFTVLLRLDGVRHLHYEGKLDDYNILNARIKDRAHIDMVERRIPQDGGFSVEHNGRVVDLRVSTVPGSHGETIVIRLLDPDRVQPNLDGLGITRLEEWRKAIRSGDGICLICGPTGSGKTTTLNATIREMDFLGRAISTVEDPVEFRMPYVTQVTINNAVGMDFPRSIRAFLRQDPDVIVVGEIRDEETARTAIKAAETGHLVLATLHTGSVVGAVSRLRDIGVEPYEMRYILRGVMAQRLVRVVCNICDGEGCHACSETGYKGRTIVSEVAYLPNSAAVDDVIAGKISWPLLVSDAVDKVEAGVTTYDELDRVIGSEAELEIIKRQGKSRK